jgi:hypothetical protein
MAIRERDHDLAFRAGNESVAAAEKGRQGFWITSVKSAAL